MNEQEGFGIHQKALFIIALILLYLSFLGGFLGIALFLSFFCCIFGIVFLEKNKSGDLKKAATKTFGFFSKLGIPLLMCFITVFIVSLFFYYAFGTEVENVTDIGYSSRSVFIVLLTAPILEEIVFRWFMLNQTKKFLERLKFRHAALAALLFSSAAFGISHTLGVVSSVRDIGIIIATFLVGIIIGKQFLKEGLVSAMWLHGTYNLILFLALYNYFWVSL